MTRVLLYETPVDLLSMEETVERAALAMRTKTRIRHTALNVAKLIKLDSDPELAQDVRESDIVGIDGMGVAWALKLFGVDRAERVPGVDLFLAILEFSAFRSFTTGHNPGTFGFTCLDQARDMLIMFLGVHRPHTGTMIQRVTDLKLIHTLGNHFQELIPD